MKTTEEIIKKWVNELRSGKYTQGQGALKKIYHKETQHCCLGVLGELIVDETENEDIVWSLSSAIRHNRYYSIGKKCSTTEFVNESMPIDIPFPFSSGNEDDLDVYRRIRYILSTKFDTSYYQEDIEELFPDHLEKHIPEKLYISIQDFLMGVNDEFHSFEAIATFIEDIVSHIMKRKYEEGFLIMGDFG